jgi:hypothetical protein
MPRLDVGERVVIEMFEPGRMSPGAWFYAWKFAADGTARSEYHAESPTTLARLLRLYAIALPDTSTAPASSESAPWALVGVACVVVVAATATVRRTAVGRR